MATLAQVVGNQAALRTWLRTLCGVDAAAMPDAACDQFLTTALQRINAMDPLLGIGSFSTVADQQKYSPAPAGAYFLRQAWWCDPQLLGWGNTPAAINTWLTQLGAAFGQPIDELGTRTALDPATVAIVLRQSEQVQRWIGTAFAVVNNGADIYLSPVPHDVRTVYFSYTAERFASVGAVTTPYFDAFWWAAQAAALGAYTVGAGSVTNVTDNQEGTSITLKSGDAAAKRAASAELSFLRCISVPAVEGWLFG